MKTVRDSIPAEDQYLRDLGRAIYNFAYLEWGIVWLTEALEPGFLRKASSLTAGGIAAHFISASAKLPVTDLDRDSMVQLAKNFERLVVERNQLVHGNPYTAENGQQRLRYSGKHGETDWTEEFVCKFSERAATLSMQANRLLHGGRYERWKSVAS